MSKTLLATKTLTILILIYAFTPIAFAHPYLILDGKSDNICLGTAHSIKSCQPFRLSYTLIKNISLKGYTIKKTRNALHAKIKNRQTTHCAKIRPSSDKNFPTKMLTLIPTLKFDLDVFALDPQSNNTLSGSPFFGISINYRRCW